MNTIKCTVMEDSSFSLMSRVLYEGANVVQADVSSITWKAFDVDDLTTAFASGTLTVSSVVFDALQTDGRWDIDTTGYNFRHDVGSTVFPTGNKTYLIEHTFTWTSGGQNILRPVFEVAVQEAYSS